MEPNSERGIRFGQIDRFLECQLIDHEAGRGQDAFFVRADDRFINGA